MRTPLLCLVLFGCTSSSEPPHIDVTSDAYTLQPGDEKYFCFAMNLPKDKDIVITKLTPTYGEGTHHILFSQTLSPEPDGMTECNVLIRTTWIPLYAGGKDSGPLELPENTGFKPLNKGQQVVMQLHLQNSTDAPITAKTSIRVDYEDASPDIQAASMFGFDDRVLSIPAHTAAAENQMNCTVDRDLNVFAVLGHMHKHGVHLDVSRGATAGAEMLYQEDWNFELQPITPMTFQVHQGDNLWLRCTHRNDGDTDLVYGESSDTEMCAFLMYYAPAATIDGCIKDM